MPSSYVSASGTALTQIKVNRGGAA